MRRTEKAAAISTAAYILLGGGMIAVALVTNSVSLIAEGVHTLTDSITSAAVWIGLRLSERHSETFPFGLYKLENLIAMVIGLLILFGAYELASESIRQLIEDQGNLENAGIALAFVAVSVVVMGFITWYKSKVAREENSPGLSADARHSMADLAAATAVFIGIGLETAGIPRADSVAALVVVVFLVWAGINVTMNGVKVLLDASIEREVLFEVKELAEAHPGVKKVLRVEGRNSGSYRFLNLSLVPRSRDLEKANHVAEEIRDIISREIANVDRVNLELQVERKGSILCAVPLAEDGFTVSSHFGEAHAFALIEIKLPEGDLLAEKMLMNPFGRLSKGKGVKVAEFLAQQGVELIMTRQQLEGKGAHYALEAQGVIEFTRPGVATLDDAQEELISSAPGL
ncbi:MAG: cation diffusion facilitator family transporter [Actinobacteria bacterium]|nr:cation diffusion facilitator family transporter [Actinomycetota bacterium]